jgi:DNA invertase Pin-like site-specific DNA recombinase
MQREESIADQRRKCHEKAAGNGHTISPELEFADEAVSGTKLHRDGLDAMLAAAVAGTFQVLYVFSLSRLSRESVITLPLLKQLVYRHGVRVVSVSENVDSNETAWEIIAHMMSIVHEQYLKDLAENVLRGQEGAVLAGFSVGDHCFGYGSRAIPESEQGRRGRNAKPRMAYVIDPEKADWVRRIYQWFVHERRSLRWIAQELNRRNAPKDHRAKTRHWRHQAVTQLLKNPKYIGVWPWGVRKNIRDPLTGCIRQKQRAAEECENWVREFPELRLIDDATFQEAARLLEANEQARAGHRKKQGTLKGSKPGPRSQHPRHLLSQLVVCSYCGRTLQVGGSGGRYLFCPGYAMGTCPCLTQLRRDRAERMILDAIGKRFLASETWRKSILKETLAAWERQASEVPSELAAAEKSLADVEQKISRLVDQVEEGEGGPELSERLAKRREERRRLIAQVERLRRTDQALPPKPTAEWVEGQLQRLGQVLSGGAPAAALALRQLVGGAIVVSEIRLPGRKRHYLQGRFVLSTPTVVNRLLGREPEEDATLKDLEAGKDEITIDFRDPPEIEALAEKARQLYDQDMMHARIAEDLGCSRSRLTKLLHHSFDSQGLPMPDGRSRRSTLEQKHMQPTLQEKLTDEVMQLYDQGMLLGEIAETKGIDRNTVTAIVGQWHKQRGLPVPDGRTRRKSLKVGSQKGYHVGRSHRRRR